MAVLCELIGYGAKFNLDEIDGKAALFHGAKITLVPYWRIYFSVALTST
jgi:hypothetical protein